MGCMLRVVRSCGSDRQAATACSQLTDMLQSWTGWRRCGRASRTSTTTRSSRRCLRSLTAWTSSARQLRCTAGACNMRQTTYNPSRTRRCDAPYGVGSPVGCAHRRRIPCCAQLSSAQLSSAQLSGVLNRASQQHRGARRCASLVVLYAARRDVRGAGRDHRRDQPPRLD